jgi:hypothetical protein
LVLLSNSNSEQPIFNNLNPDKVSVPYYAYIGAYIATIIAYDPLDKTLIQNYSIVSQPLNPNTNKPYFQIDYLSG